MVRGSSRAADLHVRRYQGHPLMQQKKDVNETKALHRNDDNQLLDCEDK
jgi:hypothetical protein